MKNLIYVVDDEKTLLEVTAVLLRRASPQWEIVTFNSPEQALTAITTTPPDLIVSDQSMPRMIGSELLDAARHIAPKAVRILVSGYIDRWDKIGAAHQVISKPYRFPDFQLRIQQALVAQDCLRNGALSRVVTSIESFPMLPDTYTELVNELSNPNGSIQKAAELVSNDGGVCTRLLQLANSPMFSQGATISDALSAIMALGTKQTLALVTSLHVFDAYHDLAFPDFSVDELWTRSLEVARVARDLCEQEKLNPGQCNAAFFAGLVYKLGQLILMENFPKDYQEILRKAEMEQCSIEELEREAFQATHTDVSCFMLHLWGMDPDVINAVATYRTPCLPAHPDRLNPSLALHLANYYYLKPQALAECPVAGDVFPIRPEFLSSFWQISGRPSI